MECTHLIFEKAETKDIETVTALYHAAVGTPGCTWDNEYPSIVTAREDLLSECLYILRMDGVIIGAVSVVSENELDGLDCFTVCDGAREFARITVAPELRGKGYAVYMLGCLTEIMKKEGTTAWHILVAVGNPAAKALYRRFGFAFLGECEMYKNRYYICEKVLDR